MLGFFGGITIHSEYPRVSRGRSPIKYGERAESDNRNVRVPPVRYSAVRRTKRVISVEAGNVSKEEGRRGMGRIKKKKMFTRVDSRARFIAPRGVRKVRELALRVTSESDVSSEISTPWV